MFSISFTGGDIYYGMAKEEVEKVLGKEGGIEESKDSENPKYIYYADRKMVNIWYREDTISKLVVWWQPEMESESDEIRTNFGISSFSTPDEIEDALGEPNNKLGMDEDHVSYSYIYEKSGNRWNRCMDKNFFSNSDSYFDSVTDERRKDYLEIGLSVYPSLSEEEGKPTLQYITIQDCLFDDRA